MPRSFVYVGKDDVSPDSVTVRGHAFKRNGEAVTVLDEALAAGLATNPEFDEVGAPEMDYDTDFTFENDESHLRATVKSLSARVSELEAINEMLVSENRELKSGLSPVEPEATREVEPISEDDWLQRRIDTLAQIDASEDWSAEHHSTRIRWANQLSEGQVRTKDEADEIILTALVDREQDAN